MKALITKIKSLAYDEEVQVSLAEVNLLIRGMRIVLDYQERCESRDFGELMLI